MAESNTTTFQGIDISKVINPPIHKHGAFDDLEANLQFVQHGIAALKGIGAMMMAGTNQMDAPIHEAASVFDFIAEAMEGPAQSAYDAMETLQRYARERGQS